MQFSYISSDKTSELEMFLLCFQMFFKNNFIYKHIFESGNEFFCFKE